MRKILLVVLLASLGCSEGTKPNLAPSIFVRPAQMEFAPEVKDPEKLKEEELSK